MSDAVRPLTDSMRNDDQDHGGHGGQAEQVREMANP
jgi:hypothetical protein